MINLPDPRLTQIYRLEATLGAVLDLGNVAPGRRRIVPLTGGTFTGPELNGNLLPGVSADWQIVLADGTALSDIRFVLQTDSGDLLYVQSRGVRHGSPEVLARLERGEDVDASEYTFRTSTQIETAAAGLDWINKGLFISVGGRQPGGVIYETYLVMSLSPERDEISEDRRRILSRTGQVLTRDPAYRRCQPADTDHPGLPLASAFPW